MKIAYLHGLESTISPEDPKIKFLNQIAVETWTPQIDYRDPHVFETLLSGIQSFKPDLIIGSSMGGWMAYLIGEATGTQTLLFNPAVVSRLFSPQVSQTPTMPTHHTLILGEKDTTIPSPKILEWFTQNSSNWIHYTYPDGHRVPAEIFSHYAQNLINHSFPKTL